MKAYWVITRSAQVWDEFRLYDATSEDDAIEQARGDDQFAYAEMRSETIEFSRIARAEELDSETIGLLELT